MGNIITFRPRLCLVAGPVSPTDADIRREIEAGAQASLAVCEALAEPRAATLDGLMLKARLAERGNREALGRSVVADLLTMGGQA